MYWLFIICAGHTSTQSKLFKNTISFTIAKVLFSKIENMSAVHCAAGIQKFWTVTDYIEKLCNNILTKKQSRQVYYMHRTKLSVCCGSDMGFVDIYYLFELSGL